MGRSNSLKNVLRLLDTATKEVPPEQSFLADLRRSIEIQDSKNRRVPSKSYKPSSMQCERLMYYNRTGTQQDAGETSYTLIGICNSGSDIHERIQTAVSKMIDSGIKCEYVDVAKFVKQHELDYLTVVSKQGMETKLYHNILNMSFLCDGIIRYNGTYYILEIKTESANKFFNRKGVDPKHFDQGTAYSVAFGIDNVIFLYISRDTLDMRTFMFEVTDDMKHNLVGKIETVDKYVKKLTPPPKPLEPIKGVCEYCSYKTQCRKDG